MTSQSAGYEQDVIRDAIGAINRLKDAQPLSNPPVPQVSDIAYRSGLANAVHLLHERYHFDSDECERCLQIAMIRGRKNCEHDMERQDGITSPQGEVMWACAKCGRTCRESRL